MTIKIGIDPDVSASGYCIKDENIIKYGTAKFFDLCDIINNYDVDSDVLVIIEGGWLNKRSNWHNSANAKTAQRIAKNVGANHQIGKLFVEFCEHEKIEYKIVKPQGKKTEKFVKMLTDLDVKNQDVRDAIMLVF